MKRAALVAAGAVLALGLGAGQARPSRTDQVTISMLVNSVPMPGYQVLIPNFERVYPKITVNATYAANNPVWYQVEPTELGAGNAPDILGGFPGCGTPVSICELAKASDVAPLVNEPWTKRSIRLVTSLGKYGQGLYGFEPTLSPLGMFTNDTLFQKLGLKIPQTFAQLLDLCQKAKADGTAAVLLTGANASTVSSLVAQLAVGTVYGPNPHFTAQQRAGSTTFDGSAGWHTALQEFIDMSNAGCFQAGATGLAASAGPFAQGQALTIPAPSSFKGSIDALSPQFGYSFHPFPATSNATQQFAGIQLGTSLSVNSHASAANQAAARTFIDFVARPAQNALYAKVVGGMTQYQFLKQQLPSFMSSFGSILKNGHYVVYPVQTWWNEAVGNVLQQDAIGLITGQETIDGVLTAMDAAWKQGPS